MTKLDCSVICDLIPLCRDGIASEESEKLVKEHIADCENCKHEFYEDFAAETDGKIEPDDKKIVGALKKRWTVALAALLIVGALIGSFAASGMSLYYNVAVMPFVGIAAYILLRPRYYIAPITVAAATIAYGALYNRISMSIYAQFAVKYAWLIMIGYFAGFLFRFALFGKETKRAKTPLFCGKISIAVVSAVCVIAPIAWYFISAMGGNK